MTTRKACLAVVMMAAIVAVPAAARAVTVDLELALLVDVSGSIDSGEYDLQLQGYVNAFNNSDVYNKIAATDNGIAVTMVQWSGKDQQAQTVGWTHITDQASSEAFATAIGNTTRQFGGMMDLTGPGAAIEFITPQFASNGFEGTVLTIDISGDGTVNSGNHPVTDDRDAAAAAGIGINCLAIETDMEDLADWYAANIQIGENSFTNAVESFDDIGDALLAKIIAEVPGEPNEPPPPPPPPPGEVPEPLTVAGLLMGVAGIAGYIRKRRMA